MGRPKAEDPTSVVGIRLKKSNRDKVRRLKVNLSAYVNALIAALPESDEKSA